MHGLFQGVIDDFSDVPSFAAGLQITIRLIMAAVLGGVLGYERARAGKSAGLRTHMLVALGAALFALVPAQAGMPLDQMSRVVQGIVTGIGFIGAGSILKQSSVHEVRGLTTAAGLWLTAAIGMAAGMGRIVTASLGTGLAFAVLACLQGVEDHLASDNSRKTNQP